MLTKHADDLHPALPSSWKIETRDRRKHSLAAAHCIKASLQYHRSITAHKLPCEAVKVVCWFWMLRYLRRLMPLLTICRLHCSSPSDLQPHRFQLTSGKLTLCCQSCAESIGAVLSETCFPSTVTACLAWQGQHHNKAIVKASTPVHEYILGMSQSMTKGFVRSKK